MIFRSKDNKTRQAAYDAVFGVFDAVAYIVLLVVLVQCGWNYFGIGIDPTDKDGWSRSGLAYYKDYGTGQEYISAPGGVLIPRAVPESEVE